MVIINLLNKQQAEVGTLPCPPPGAHCILCGSIPGMPQPCLLCEASQSGSWDIATCAVRASSAQPEREACRNNVAPRRTDQPSLGEGGRGLPGRGACAGLCRMPDFWQGRKLRCKHSRPREQHVQRCWLEEPRVFALCSELPLMTLILSR